MQTAKAIPIGIKPVEDKENFGLNPEEQNNLMVSSIENHLRRLAQHQAMPLPSWFMV